MNKDVIYIEPEDDITDIIAKIKDAKNKIVALVPPKKAGILRSAVNFKLIAKTATQKEKTVVLVSADASLIKLASNVKMPVAKTLNSKPELIVDKETAMEFGDKDGDLIEETSSAEKSEKSDKSEKDDAKTDAKKSANDDAPAKGKKAAAKSGKKIPNFGKYQKPIIFGSIAAVFLIILLIWAFAIAPAAEVVVTVATSQKNFSKSVSFVADEASADLEEGIFLLEEQSVEKSYDTDFEATGEQDKGTKASGVITIKRTSPVTRGQRDDGEWESWAELTVPAGTNFVYNGQSYVSSSAVSLASASGNVTGCTANNNIQSCNLRRDITAEVSVIAKDNGDKFNMSATTSGWTTSASGITVSKASEMTGGTTKMVKIVSSEDLEKAENSLDSISESSIKSELKEELGKNYIIIDSSFKAGNPQISSSPALNEEVNDGTTPKFVKKVTYTVSAVKRSDVEEYIKKLAEDDLGDDTQTVYSTGADSDSELKAFFDKYKADTQSATLKSTILTGPKVTEDMVKDASLGKRPSEIRSALSSINGVKEVDVKTSGFWVTSVPNDINKVQIEIKVEE